MTHPVFTEAVVRQRHANLLATAHRGRARPVRPPRLRNRRQRLGWLLVEWGLHLATKRPAA